jgi:pimeloyl-ACP methyl ester carboxylesterase
MRTDTSCLVDLDGPTHYVDFGGQPGSPPLVAVHGLGGSHANWLAIGPRLAEHQRVLAPDLAGHGLTRPDHRATDVDANQWLLDRFLREVSGIPAVLMGNSMGGLISILQASRNPETVAGLVLLDPAIPSPPSRPDLRVMATFTSYAVPGLGAAMLARRRRRLTPEQQVQQVLDLCCVDPDRVPVDVVRRAAELARERQSFGHLDKAFLDAARSVMLHVARRERLAAHMRAVQAPVLLLHGDKDRLVPVSATRLAARTHPDWHVEIAPNVGHVPQLEAADWTVDAYVRWRASLSGPRAD